MGSLRLHGFGREPRSYDTAAPFEGDPTDI